MGHHINDKNQFQSDRYPNLAPDKIVLSFKDPLAREALSLYAGLCTDIELGDDIFEQIRTIS